jgi:hypothetical protein
MGQRRLWREPMEERYSGTVYEYSSFRFLVERLEKDRGKNYTAASIFSPTNQKRIIG